MSDIKSKDVHKLAEDNYASWQFQMKMLLQSKDLWFGVFVDAPRNPLPVVRGSSEPAAAFEARSTVYLVAEEAFRQWRLKDHKAFNYIGMSLDQQNVNLVCHLDSGVEAWNVLRESHQIASMGNKLRTKKKLMQAKFRKGMSMREHLGMLTQLFNTLAAINSPVAEDEKVITILSSVEEEYAALVTAIMSWSEDRLTVRQVSDRLLEEWDKENFSKPSRESSNGGKNANQEAGLAALKKGPLCWTCKEYGHISRACPKNRHQQPKEGGDLRHLLNNLRDKQGNKDAENYSSCFFISSDAEGFWVIDSGATSHMTSSKELFSAVNLKHRSGVVVANGETLMAKGKGDVQVKVTSTVGATTTLTLKDVLWVPGLCANLLSVRKFTNDGLAVGFDQKCVWLEQAGTKTVIGSAKSGHYQLFGDAKCMKVDECQNEEKLCVHQWHRRMAHRNLYDIKQMAKQGLKIRECKCSNDCEHCLIGKMARKPFGVALPTVNVMDVVVSDACGPFQVESLSGKRYYVTFIDVASRYCEVDFITKKSEVTEKTIQFIERMKTQLGKKPKIFRSDQGTEYMDQRLQSYLRNEGIKTQCTVGYAPEQNGIAERKNRTLVEASRCMLSDSKLPKNHWAESVNMANHVLNRIVDQKSGKSPFELMWDIKPKWNQLRTFGCEAYVMIPREKRRKLDPKSIKMKFVGFDERSKGFRMSDGKRVTVSREVRFLSDTEPISKQKQVKEKITIPPEPMPEFEEEENDDHDNLDEPVAQQQQEIRVDDDPYGDDEFISAEEDEIVEEEPAVVQIIPRRSRRANIGVRPAHFDDFEMESDGDDDAHLVIDSLHEPKSFSEAIDSPHAKEWIEAMHEELKSIKENETWEICKLPQGRKAIGSKWVFKTKLDENGNLVGRKARLVAQGYSQKYGVDYDEVFAPVARSASMKILLSVAGTRKYVVKQYDIKTAFLNGSLEEEIFMKPPPGQHHQYGEVCRLKKSLYGLKQAARVWNQVLHESLTKNGCKQNETDNCLYVLTSGGEIVYLLIHVDDVLAATNNEKILDNLMMNVAKDFELKSLGEAKTYLGINLERDGDGNFLISQPGYIAKIIASAGLTNAKTSKFPLDTGYFKVNGVELQSNEEYRKIIGMLLFLATNTRPDISASVAILSQRVQNPRDVDLNEAKRVVRYLIGTQYLKLRLSTNEGTGEIFAYSDSDWAEDKDRKSISGMFCIVNGGAVMWSCRKQTTVALSSAEAEYVALSETCKEMIWIRRVATAFDIKSLAPVTIFTDSQSAMAMVENDKFSHRTKHIDTRYHFVKDMVNNGTFKLKYQPTETNIADMLTKPLGGNKIQQLREMGGLHHESSNKKF